ncbi:pleckstrin homology domain-containing family A member 5 isoform X9 [Hypanus sabinus]|uniref:pleckstrin homology domain-containing family A member 5 isoform X9 n=1 Tax=Hypanus sabinus TaxID=79690 RepID=UPI0028C37C37|nr:pleckstrin homology domain-containing family A member 5 isoform X9 [Hypanus sabinus]
MADCKSEWLRLPGSWSHGVTRDGRVFFIDEEAQRTTWLHPATGEAVISGHRKTADLPTGWEEGYTFEGARYYINHNEWKVTCKHPVTGHTSQENCIFVMNDDFRTAAAIPSQDKKDRPVSLVSEVSTYTMASEMALLPTSPVCRSSRPSKKIHNFGKRSNSIKRNANAPVIKHGWLYKQDSTGMKLWKKRWFVLADLCLFYYRDEKEEGILGSILLPSFKITPVMPEDHINRKYAFKAAHSNMRTYYFYTETAKEMESWMKAMIEAALVQTEPVKRMEKVASEIAPRQEVNHVANHKILVKPELKSNQQNIDSTLSHKSINNTSITHTDKYGFEPDGQDQHKPLTKINSVKLHPAKSETENVASSTTTVQILQYKSLQANSSNEHSPIGPICDPVGNMTFGRERLVSQNETGRGIQRTNSMVQLEQWVKTQKGKGQEEEPRSVTCYQTLPRNLPSYRTQTMPCYRTLPRHSSTRADSVCTMMPSAYDRVIRAPSSQEKRKSMRDDTMWQLYEWQQRQVYNKHGTLSRHGAPLTMVNLVDQSRSIPPSPSHGSLAPYQVYSPLRSYNMESRLELSPPVLRGDMTIDSIKSRRYRTPVNRINCPPERKSMPAGLPVQTLTAENLQGKTLAQHDEYRETLYSHRTEELDVDAKLSQLCEQDKVVHEQEEKLQQLHKEKHTLEQALLAASQEIEMNADNPSVVQSVALQRDVLQNGLLSTCREISRATAELERMWREYDKLEYDVTLARNHLHEQLDRFEGVQADLAGHQRSQIQKELWRIEDVMEGLSKNKQQRNIAIAVSQSGPASTLRHRQEGPDYRQYKSEPELTTVTEVDESNVDEKSEVVPDKESVVSKGLSFPIGIVPPRSKSPISESSTIASYVTLRKHRKMDGTVPHVERPRSAVEQLFLAEGPRPRMSVEEQLERIKRHQQASLKDKRKGLSLLALQDQSPAKNLSRENNQAKPLHPMDKYSLYRNRTVENNIKDLETAVRNDNYDQHPETAAEEIARLKEGNIESIQQQSESRKDFPSQELKIERCNEAETEMPSPNKIMSKSTTIDGIEIKSSVQTVTPVINLKTNTDEENAEEGVRLITISNEVATDAPRSSKLVRENNLSPPKSPKSPSPSHPQLTEGSHFMCV